MREKTKKRILSWVLSASMLLSQMPGLTLSASANWTGASSTDWLGAGIESDPYVIASPDDLAYLADAVSGGNTYDGVYFKLDQDIAFNEWNFSFDADTGLVTATDGYSTIYIGTGVAGDASGSNTTFDSTASTTGTYYSSNTNANSMYTPPNIINVMGLYAFDGIGSEDYPFAGTFDGNGHSISNMFIDSTESGTGLFNWLTGTVTDVTLDNALVIGAGYDAGGIAGIMNTYNDNVQVTDCQNNGLVIGVEDVGGIVGGAYSFDGDYVEDTDGSAAIIGCTNDSQVIGTDDVGGIAGYLDSYCNISACGNNGAVTATDADDSHAGGITGYLYPYTADEVEKIENCYNTGTIAGAGDHLGGIAGELNGNISHCFNTGDVIGSGGLGVGGIVGEIGTDSADGDIIFCYNDGNISGYNGVGGIVGISEGDSVLMCYNTGSVTAPGTSQAGAIMGEGSAFIDSCYYDGQMCTTGDSNGGTAKATFDMLGNRIFDGGEWSTSAPDLYPHLAAIDTTYAATNAATKLSIAPIFLDSNDTADAVTTNFTVSTANGVTWSSGNTSVISISGSAATVTPATTDTDVTLTATCGTVTRKVYLCVTGVPASDPPATSGFAGGTGASDDPYQIANASQLTYMAKQVNDGVSGYSTAYYKLTADISLNDMSVAFDADTGLVGVTTDSSTYYFGTDSYGDDSGTNDTFDDDYSHIGTIYTDKNGAEAEGDPVSALLTAWTPIGSSENPFQGHFDGDDHTISGLYTPMVSEHDNFFNADFLVMQDNQGLFGYLNGSGEIKNVSIASNSLVIGDDYVGGVVGYVASTAESLWALTGCTNNGIVLSDGGSAGGILGYTFGLKTVISSCTNTGTILAAREDYIGGIVGYLGTDRGGVSTCANTGAVFGESYVGGIVGYYESIDSFISDCENAGSITAEEYVGGILGEGDGGGDISCCVNSGDITAEDYDVGGIAGECEDNISYCYNTGDIQAGDAVGGVAGECGGDISYCYSTGNIQADYDVGGIVYDTSGNVTNCYNMGKLSASRYALGGLVASLDAGTINHCYNAGPLVVTKEDGNDYEVGGLVGKMYSGAVLRNSYSSGTITVWDNDENASNDDEYHCYIGSLIGYEYDSDVTVTNCVYDAQMSTFFDIGGTQDGACTANCDATAAVLTYELLFDTYTSTDIDNTAAWTPDSHGYLYPRLADPSAEGITFDMDGTDAAVLSAIPLGLFHSADSYETADAVKYDILIQPEGAPYTAEWASSNEDLVKPLSGASGYYGLEINYPIGTVQLPQSDTQVELTVSQNGVSRIIELNVPMILVNAAATTAESLTPNNLDGTQVTLTLNNTTFSDSALDVSNFTLQDAPNGLTIAGVSYVSDTECTATLAYTGGYVAGRVDFSIGIANAEVAYDGDLTSTDLCVDGSWDGTVANAFADGDGTSGNPYQIATGTQLAYLEAQVNAGTDYTDTYFVLTQNIYLNYGWDFVFDQDTGLIKASNDDTTVYIGTGIRGDESDANTTFDETASTAGTYLRPALDCWNPRRKILKMHGCQSPLSWLTCPIGYINSAPDKSAACAQGHRACFRALLYNSPAESSPSIHSTVSSAQFVQEILSSSSRSAPIRR